MVGSKGKTNIFVKEKKIPTNTVLQRVKYNRWPLKVFHESLLTELFILNSHGLHFSPYILLFCSTTLLRLFSASCNISNPKIKYVPLSSKLGGQVSNGNCHQ